MATTPDHITITVDEEALRRQIHGIIQQEVKEFSYALRRAADALDPEYATWLENHLRAKWEAEQVKPDKRGGSNE